MLQNRLGFSKDVQVKVGKVSPVGIVAKLSERSRGVSPDKIRSCLMQGCTGLCATEGWLPVLGFKVSGILGMN